MNSPVDLGLDISTTYIGYCFIERNTGKVILWGAIDIAEEGGKELSLVRKADIALKLLQKLFQKVGGKPDKTYVEASATAYGSATTAQVLAMLAKINAMVCAGLWFCCGIEATPVNVTSARSKIGFKRTKEMKSKEVKEKVAEFVETTYGLVPKKRPLTSGKNKGNLVYADGALDAIDAFVIVKGGTILCSTQSPTPKRRNSQSK